MSKLTPEDYQNIIMRLIFSNWEKHYSTDDTSVEITINDGMYKHVWRGNNNSLLTEPIDYLYNKIMGIKDEGTN